MKRIKDEAGRTIGDAGKVLTRCSWSEIITIQQHLMPLIQHQPKPHKLQQPLLWVEFWLLGFKGGAGLLRQTGNSHCSTLLCCYFSSCSWKHTQAFLQTETTGLYTDDINLPQVTAALLLTTGVSPPLRRCHIQDAVAVGRLRAFKGSKRRNSCR